MESSKTREVQFALRRRIVDGVYAPGERMPTFDALVSEFDVSRMVVQHAVARLRQDGFVRTVNRRGLYVSEAPPHLYRVALLLADAPEDASWPRMNTAMVNETMRLEREHADWQFKVCEGVMKASAGRSVLARVERDAEAHRLAGVIFTPQTFDLSRRPALANPELPKAFVCAPEDSGVAAIVGVDSAGLYRRALERLAMKGRRRIAMLHMADTTRDVDHATLFSSFRLKLHRPWIQWVGRSHPQFAEQIVRLLLDYPAKNRPDGLIVADDNLIEHAAAGIAASGLTVGRHLDVVAHCNWPWPLPSVLPFERIGFDATDILRRSIEAIVSQRQGEPPPAPQRVPALFEWELGGAVRPLPDPVAAD